MVAADPRACGTLENVVEKSAVPSYEQYKKRMEILDRELLDNLLYVALGTWAFAASLMACNIIYELIKY